MMVASPESWLPSFRPYGTKVSFLMLTRVRGRGKAALHESDIGEHGRTTKRTARPTKLLVYRLEAESA
jgi:hypothetical protein